MPAHASFAPPLPGPYCVGLERRTLVDGTRTDPFSRDATAPRQLSVTLHYPIEPGSHAEPAPYGELELWGVLYSEALTPGMVSNAVLGERIAQRAGGFPLVLYSPGFRTGLAETNTLMIHALVSHGYIVAAVDHPHVSHAVRLDDGTIVRFGDGLPALAVPEDAASSDARAVYAFPVVVDDLRFVLDQLLQLGDTEPAWRARIDPQRIGAFGHSYGGAAAAELVRSDPRVRAGIDYDGRFHADVLEQGIGGPLLLVAIEGRITAAAPPNNNFGYRQALASAVPGHYVEIAGAVHSMFQADMGVLLKRKLGDNDARFSGEVDADLNLEICSVYNLDFFRTYLEGGPPAALEALAARYEGVESGVASTPPAP